MYYYILENSQGKNFINFQNKLKQTLTNLNISGEVAVASPARSAEVLAALALERGYTTIVAVGGDLLVNRLASSLATSQAALGVIPYGLSPELGRLFTGTDLLNACNSLRSRKTAIIDLGHIAPNKYFLSDASLESEKPITCTLEIDDQYSLEARIQHLLINRDLRVRFLTDIPKKQSWWNRKKSDNMNPETRIMAKDHINIFTSEPISITVSSHEIVKTPIQVKKAKEVLKIITNRDTIN